MTNYFDLPIKGVDVSVYNGAIDWAKVRADFVAIRVGHGRVLDKAFKTNWAGAKGMTYRIPYWYMDYYSHISLGISDADWGRIQAEKYWEAVKDDRSSIVFLDIESASVADHPIQEVKGRVLAIARSFLKRADELSGSLNGIYISISMVNWLTEDFRTRPLWVAWYTRGQTAVSVLKAVRDKGWKGEVLIWQYASDGDLDGNGTKDGKSMGMQYDALDLNMWLGTEADFVRWTGGQAGPAQPVPGDNPLYRVRVTVGNLLVRKGPGTNYAMEAEYAKGEYEVYEEVNGFGRIGANRWIYLAYTEKVSSVGVPPGEPSDAEKLRILWDWYKGSR